MGGTARAVPAPRVAATLESLTALRARPPRTAAELAAAVRTMELSSPAYFRAVIEPAAHAERLATDLRRPDLQMRARLVRAEAALRRGEPASAGRLAQQVLGWATEQGDDHLVARSHYMLAMFYRHVGDVASVLAHAVQSVSHTTEQTPAAIRARHLCMLACALDENGSPDECARRFAEALDLATAVDDAELTMLVLNNMAYTAYEAGDEPEARRLAERMRAIEADHHLPARANYLDTIARVEMMSGRCAEAEATLRPVLDDSGRHMLFDGDALAECLLTVAEAQRERGDLVRARATLLRAAEVCDDGGLAAHRARVRQQQALVHAAHGHYREAYQEHVRFYEQAQALQSAQREARARLVQAAFEIDEARRTSELFRELAQRDPLTGLHNRRFVNERLPMLLRWAQERDAPLSAALVDLDHFKRINDTLSHGAGDAVLQQVGTLLAAATPDPLFAARMGGEEFLLVLPDTDADDARRLCDQLRAAIRQQPWTSITGRLPVTASVGLTTVPDGRISPSALLAAADRNLYAAKRGGRDRLVADAT